ncbi:MAG: hypothetical protein ACYTF6_03135, partial [Planctomycetota bacterium]
ANLDQKGVMSIAFCAIGAFIAVQVLPELTRNLFFVIRGDITFGELWSSGEWQAKLWSDVAKFVLAIWFLFGSRGIANMIRRFRSRGLEEPPEGCS